VKIGDIDRFFEDLSLRVHRPVLILLTGGAAAILQGVERATFDIDFEVALKKVVRKSTDPRHDWDAIQKAIEATSRSTGITPQYSEDIDQWSSIALPAKKSRLYRRFGKVEVRILDPGLWAIGKLARYLSTDVQDLRVVLKAANTRPKTMVKLWGTALGISPASSSQATFRKQVESFLDQHAREIWGVQGDSEGLKRLFLETAKKARRHAPDRA
jgi:hypothetical protein